MSVTSNFTGSDFFLESVTQIAAATIRVRFAQDPLASSPSGAHDARNISLYGLTGPAVNVITASNIVPNDPQAIDLTLAAPLEIGDWTLSGSSALQTAGGRPLQPPRAITFTVSFLGDQGSIAQGAVNDGPEQVIRKHLGPAFVGKAWNALIAALAVGDRLNWDNAVLAFDQLFKSTAAGNYLDRKSGDDGLTRPPDIGMPDDLFRQYSIKTTTKKLTQEVLLEILEVFYGSDAVRAYVETDAVEPFVLADGQDLQLLLDERDPYTVTFRSQDFASIGQARAIELAAAITRFFRLNRSKAFAVAVTDPTSGSAKVRIYSGALGLGSSVRVTGGIGQRILRFPELVEVYGGDVSFAGYNWVYSTPAPGQTKLELSITGSSLIDLSKVQEGDYVIIGEDASSIVGVFPVSHVSISYSGSTLIQSITIDQDLGQNGSHAQLSNTAYVFFRPRRQSIYQASGRNIVVAQTQPSIIKAVLPATTQAVGRTARSASYGQLQSPLTITALVRNSSGLVTVTAPGHTLSVGDQVMVEQARSSISAPAITGSTGAGVSDSTLGSHWTATNPVSPVPSADGGTITVLLDGTAFMTGGKYIDSLSSPAWSNQTSKFLVTSLTTLGDGSRRANFTYVAGPTLTAARAYHQASLLTDNVFSGRVLVAGGHNGTSFLSSAQVYNPTTNTFAAAAAMGTARATHSLLTLQNGKVLALGGTATNGSGLATAELFTPGGSWTAAASMNQARCLAQAVVLSSGKVLVVGGLPSWDSAHASSPEFSNTALATSEVYDPGTNTWTRSGSMTWTRYWHRLVLLSDDRVLVMGGRGYRASLAATFGQLVDAEIWDPQTGGWSPAGKLPTGDAQQVAAYLSSRDQVVTESALFDTTTGAVRVAPHNVAGTIQGLGDLRSAVLPQDLVLVIPGSGTAGNQYPAYLYIPGSDVRSGGGLNGLFEVTSASGTQFGFHTPRRGYAVNEADLVVRPVAAAASSIPGPFTFDPEAGAAVTGIEATLTTDLAAGRQYTVLNLDDATQFPDAEGWLCIGFGTEHAVSPIRYLGRFSSTGLLLDYQYRFTANNPAGSRVTLLSQKAAFVPEHPEQVGSAYITASAAGRLAAQAAMEASTAAGIELDAEVVYPGDKGLGGAGLPVTGTKISDKVAIWGGDDIDAEVAAARGDE